MAEKVRQQEYWDQNLDAQNLGASVSDSPESLLEELKFSSIPDIEQMISHLEPKPGQYLLEIGSGLGANAVLVRNLGASVVALDMSHERLALLKARTTRISGATGGKILPVKARAEALPFKDGSLDGAFTRAVLIHTCLPEVCDEIARVIRPGAPVAFSEPMAHNPLVKLYRLTVAPREWRKITTYFTKKEAAVVGARFVGVDVRRLYVLAFLPFIFQYALPSPAFFYGTLPWVIGWDRRIQKMWKSYDRFAWFVLITGRKAGD